MSKPDTAWIQDQKIGETISKIVFDFIDEHGNEVVLLYHCDFADGKQKGRDKIFKAWYENSSIKEGMVRKRIEIREIKENGESIDYYMGYITSDLNPLKEDVESEFSLFAEKFSGK
jgi:hypothetical protein